MSPEAIKSHLETPILVTATEAQNAQDLESRLIAAGLKNVRSTTDMSETAALFEKWPFRLLVLDMQTREAEGLNVVKELKLKVGTRPLGLISVVKDKRLGIARELLTLGVLDVMAASEARQEIVARVRMAIATVDHGGHFSAMEGVARVHAR